MADLTQIALEALRRNPNVANSPQGQQFMQILQSGDTQKGIEMAQNICQSYGTTPEEALKKAKGFFNL